MAATVRVSYFGGSAGEPAGVNAESGITWSESDAQAPASGTAPVSIPTATGTAFSWIMQLALEVTVIDAGTSLSNRTIAWASAQAAGTDAFFGDLATYRQPASGNAPPDQGSDDATPAVTGAGGPASYTKLTTTDQGWDAGSDSAGSTGRNGNFAETVFGVDSTFAGGGGQVSLPNLTVKYDES